MAEKSGSQLYLKSGINQIDLEVARDQIDMQMHESMKVFMSVHNFVNIVVHTLSFIDWFKNINKQFIKHISNV